jgi:hypothetical protein
MYVMIIIVEYHVSTMGRQMICFMIMKKYDICGKKLSFLHEVSYDCGCTYGICGKYNCTCIISLHHAHFCYEHMHRARSVRKSYNYSRVLLS